MCADKGRSKQTKPRGGQRVVPSNRHGWRTAGGTHGYWGLGGVGCAWWAPAAPGCQLKKQTVALISTSQASSAAAATSLTATGAGSPRCAPSAQARTTTPATTSCSVRDPGWKLSRVHVTQLTPSGSAVPCRRRACTRTSSSPWRTSRTPAGVLTGYAWEHQGVEPDRDSWAKQQIQRGSTCSEREEELQR